MSFLRGNAIGLLALFVALGGTAYAAVNLPKNSVGTKQLKAGAVTKAKIKKSVIGQLHEQQGPPGATGAQGPTGITGSTGPQGPGAKGIHYENNSIAGPGQPVTLTSAGPFTVKAQCYVTSGPAYSVRIYVNSSQDGNYTINESHRVAGTTFSSFATYGLSANTDNVVVSTGASSGQQAEQFSEIILDAGGSFATLTAFAQVYAIGTPGCFVSGTLTPAS